MEPSSIAEQRANAIAKLKRAASLPRMKDGRRPPMHVEAVSEGERVNGSPRPEEESAPDSDSKPETVQPPEDIQPAKLVEDSSRAEVSAPEQEVNGEPEEKVDDVGLSEIAPDRPSTPARKRRSRSRARSRGSKDLRNKPKTPPPPNNESSADEYVPDEIPPSPPVVSPIPSRFAAFQATQIMRTGLVSPGPALFYPGTTPSTPLLSLDELQKGIQTGLLRSNSVGAARMMAMQKLNGRSDPSDMGFTSTSPTPPQFSLNRNNTVSGGESGQRVAARRNLLRKLGERVKEGPDADLTSGEELTRPTTPGAAKKRRRRSRRSSSRASLLDDRDDREQLSTSSPHTPVVLGSSSAPATRTPELQFPLPLDSRRTPIPQVLLLDQDFAPMGGRGPVVEDDYEEGRSAPAVNTFQGLPVTPSRRLGQRLPHTSDAPSTVSSSSAVPIPFFLSNQPATWKHDMFPASPFATPLREGPFSDGDEDSEAYRGLPARAPTRTGINRDNEVSWVDPVPPSHTLPINDEDDDDEEEEEEEEEEEVLEKPHADHAEPDDDAEPELEENAEHEESAEPSDNRSSHSYYADDAPPEPSLAPRKLFIEVETSPEMSPLHVPPSPSSVFALSTPATTEFPPMNQPSPQTYPMRLSVAPPMLQQERSPSAADSPEWDEARAESTPKREKDGTSAWERVKNTFTRSNSSNGRRSRTNSINARDRRYNTDSSVSRESGMSLSGGKEKGDRSSFAGQQPQATGPLMQSPSASASIVSLAPQVVRAGGASPVPPSSTDMSKYADSKLFPFPGMQQLAEKRNKTKGFPPSVSSPDIISAPNGIEAIPSTSSSSSITTKTPEAPREQKLSHQASDSRLLTKFNIVGGAPQVSTTFSSGSNDYFSLSSGQSTNLSTSSSLKLPTNREGVRRWLSAKKLFSSSSSAVSTPNIPLSPPVEKNRDATKKPSLADLLSARKESDLAADWEDIGSDKSRTPTSPIGVSPFGPLGKHAGKESTNLPMKPAEIHVNVSAYVRQDPTDSAQSPQSVAIQASVANSTSSSGYTPLPSPPEPPSSTTPDPQSSVSGGYTGSDSLSSSRNSPGASTGGPSKATIMMERLDEALSRGSKSNIWPIAIDNPPRKLVLSSPVLQVANANTVKDRFLFLFSDIIVIAKPVVQDSDALLDVAKPTPMDRKYIVKSVALLKDLKFSADRDESKSRMTANAGPNRHPVVRTFVNQFAQDPDHAISSLFENLNSRDDPVALGQLIFRTTDIDRARLGEYLSRRTSKVVLKAYVDSFGFTGLRIDKALRVFLLSMCIPPKAALDYLVDSFASRWYEANAKVVAYGKDLAIRLVRSIVQLNELMHGGIAQTPGMTGYPKRNVISRDFVEAFRRFDPRCLVSDELLDKVYATVRRERLSQARNTSNEGCTPDISISVKRPLPPRLTYRVQSEPIILRIPQPDTQLSIQLFGQDLVFDPPTLNFSKSAEASFRVTGTSLGPKTIIMWRSGPNALLYSGLPVSSPVMVERAFMRNTFQLAFLNHDKAKRKYMFSVDDPLIRHQWTVSLKRQIDIASTPAPSIDRQSSAASSRTRDALEAIAFKVLQDTIISNPDDEDAVFSPSAVDQALARLTGIPNGGNGYIYAGHDGSHRRSRMDGASSHIRSKSRSQIYHRHGAGQLEPDLSDDHDTSDDGLLRRDPSSTSYRPGERLWSGRDLEVVCRQNSSLPAVLTYLRVESNDETPGAVV